MSYQRPQRKSPRLRGYDYSQSGAYFITICTYKREHCFGAIADGVMRPRLLGLVASACWHAIPDHFVDVELDAFVVMPNHVHGVILLPGGGAALGTVIGAYKAAVTRQARQELRDPPECIWQSRYHDHIIRNERALEHIRAYIGYNPMRWSEDRLNG